MELYRRARGVLPSVFTFIRTVIYEHNARSGGTPAAPREKDLVWRLVAGGVG